MFGKCRCEYEDSTKELLPKNCHAQITNTLCTPAMNILGENSVFNSNSVKAIIASIKVSCKFY